MTTNPFASPGFPGCTDGFTAVGASSSLPVPVFWQLPPLQSRLHLIPLHSNKQFPPGQDITHMSESFSQCMLQCPLVQVCRHSFALHLMLVQFFSQIWLQSPWSVVHWKSAQLPPKHSLLHSFAVHLISQAPCAQVC